MLSLLHELLIGCLIILLPAPPPVGESTEVAGSRTADDKIAIVRSDGPDSKWYFRDLQSQESLGTAFGSDELKGIRSFSCSWSPSANTVIISIQYGAKLSSVAVFKRTKSGFVRVPFTPPEPIPRGELPQLEQFSGGTSDRVGRWIDKDHIEMVASHYKDLEDGPRTWLLEYTLDVTLSRLAVERRNSFKRVTQKEAGKILSKYRQQRTSAD